MNQLERVVRVRNVVIQQPPEIIFQRGRWSKVASASLARRRNRVKRVLHLCLLVTCNPFRCRHHHHHPICHLASGLSSLPCPVSCAGFLVRKPYRVVPLSLAPPVVRNIHKVFYIRENFQQIHPERICIVTQGIRSFRCWIQLTVAIYDFHFLILHHSLSLLQKMVSCHLIPNSTAFRFKLRDSIFKFA